MRLIDADALIADCNIYNSWDAQIVKDVVTAWIDDQNTVDAEPVRHGHWVRIKYAEGDWMRCSACEENIWTAGEFAGLGSLERFCPHCGAKMLGGE